MASDDFEILVNQYYEDLYRFAWSLARNEADACDLTQQAFAIYAEKREQIRETGKRKNWLFTTLYREFLKMRERGLRQIPMEHESLEIASDAMPSEIERQAQQGELIQTLLGLEQSQRAILSLFYLDQHSYKDIAVILNIPIGTVMSRLARAKEKLREELERGKTGINIIPLPSDLRKTDNG